MQQKIIPNLWFANESEEAAEYYVSIFRNSRIVNIMRYGEAGAEVSGQPVGSVMTVEYQIEGKTFIALNGGPVFKFTPAISMFVTCRTRDEVDELWKRLSAGGKALLALGEYPFSKRYGWVEDRYGLSWQVSIGESRRITPSLLFAGNQRGKAEAAMNQYIPLFGNSGIKQIERYGRGEPGKEGTVKFALFALDGEDFIAMDSGTEDPVSFTPAVSLLVNCETQGEVDKFWDKLSEDGEKEPCGWLKDRYGVSWQVVPSILDKLLQDRDENKVEQVTKAMLKMSKLDIKTLKEAYEHQPAGKGV